MNLKNKINNQNRNRLIDTENILIVARGRGLEGMYKKGEGIKKYKLIVAEWSQGCKVHYREYSQYFNTGWCHMGMRFIGAIT